MLYVVGMVIMLCLSEGLHFCVEEPKFELENYPKEDKDLQWRWT